MRLLVDQNVPRAVVKGLREDGHNVTWAQTAHPGADDEVLLERAQKESRVLLTVDTDFGMLASGDDSSSGRLGRLFFCGGRCANPDASPIQLIEWPEMTHS